MNTEHAQLLTQKSITSKFKTHFLAVRRLAMRVETKLQTADRSHNDDYCERMLHICIQKSKMVKIDCT